MTLMDEIREGLAKDPDLDRQYRRELRQLHEEDEGLRPCDCDSRGHTSPLVEIAGAVLMVLFLPLMLPLLYLDAKRQARALRGTGDL